MAREQPGAGPVRLREKVASVTPEELCRGDLGGWCVVREAFVTWEWRGGGRFWIVRRAGDREIVSASYSRKEAVERGEDLGFEVRDPYRRTRAGRKRRRQLKIPFPE